MEIAGSQPAVVRGSLHGPDYFGGGAFVNQLALASGTFADSFHVFAVEWTHDGIRWLVDEQPYHVRLRSDLETIGRMWVFDQPFYLILNLAVGGVFDGPPSNATPFPSEMTVDYVKVLRLVP
jgi:beta-glucanase (GH16 family)